MRRGFTLIELLMALAISAFVMMSVYVIFSSAIDTKQRLEDSNDSLLTRGALQRLMARDIRLMLADTVKNLPADPQNKRVFAINSQNSLTFNKAISVELIYEVDNSTLYRTEQRPNMNYKMKMPLMDNVTEWKAYSFNGSEYKENFDSRARIFKFSFMRDGAQMEFTVGKGLEITQ